MNRQKPGPKEEAALLPSPVSGTVECLRMRGCLRAVMAGTPKDDFSPVVEGAVISLTTLLALRRHLKRIRERSALREVF